jgi:uncharacterized protein YcnI
MTTNNPTADGFANQRTKIKQSKAMGMRFYWVQDRVQDGQFQVHWLQGELDHTDYFTKHWSLAHPSHQGETNLLAHWQFSTGHITPDCRGVLIWDPQLAEPRDPGSLSSQSSVI